LHQYLPASRFISDPDKQFFRRGQAFVDQLLLRVGKSEHRGWLRYHFPKQSSVSKPAFFVIRGAFRYSNTIRILLMSWTTGSWLYHYEDEMMEDPGMRLVKLPTCRLAFSTEATNFDLIDAEGQQIHFECGGREINTEIPQQHALVADAAGKSSTAAESDPWTLHMQFFAMRSAEPSAAAWAAAIAAKGAQVESGLPPPRPSAASPPGVKLAASAGEAPQVGGKAYQPAEYDGGAELYEAEPLLRGDFMQKDAQWRSVGPPRCRWMGGHIGFLTGMEGGEPVTGNRAGNRAEKKCDDVEEWLASLGGTPWTIRGEELRGRGYARDCASRGQLDRRRTHTTSLNAIRA
jgi:hypothetical protein